MRDWVCAHWADGYPRSWRRKAERPAVQARIRARVEGRTEPTHTSGT
jgi:hypothetical protein